MTRHREAQPYLLSSLSEQDRERFKARAARFAVVVHAGFEKGLLRTRKKGLVQSRSRKFELLLEAEAAALYSTAVVMGLSALADHLLLGKPDGMYVVTAHPGEECPTDVGHFHVVHGEVGGLVVSPAEEAPAQRRDPVH